MTTMQNEMRSLTGKNAVVTGASRGVGAQIAIELARRGANVALCYRSESSAGKIAELIRTIRGFDTSAVPICEDLAVLGCGQRIISSALEQLGATEIHILVNNAALDPPEPMPVLETTVKQFDEFMQVNVKAALELVQAAAPKLPARGGRIISISSVLAQAPDVPFAAWAASKAALECLSRYWAMELGPERHLTSNIIAIGPTLTDYHADDPPEVLQALSQLPCAEKRMGTTDDVAQIAAFLASDASRWISGDVIQGNGGMRFG